MLRKLVPIEKKSMFPINFAFYYYIYKYICVNAFKNFMQNRWNEFCRCLYSLGPFASFNPHLQINISFSVLYGTNVKG